MINLSVFSTYVMERTFDAPEDGLAHMYNLGIKHTDITDDMLSKYSLHQHMGYFNNIGMKADTLVSFLDFVTGDCTTRKKNLGFIKGYIDFMEKNNIPILMPAPDVIPTRSAADMCRMRENMIEGLDELITYAKDSGVTVAIENQSTTTRPDSKIADMKELFNALPELKYILDSGNFYCIGEDVIEAYKAMKDRVVHVHFKDWKEDMFGCIVRENIPRLGGAVLGSGILPLHELAQQLKRDNYNGSVVLEINSPDFTVRDLDLSAQFLKSVFDY